MKNDEAKSTADLQKQLVEEWAEMAKDERNLDSDILEVLFEKHQAENMSFDELAKHLGSGIEKYATKQQLIASGMPMEEVNKRLHKRRTA